VSITNVTKIIVNIHLDLHQAGEVLSTTYGNGMTGAYTYNNQLQLGSVSASNAGTAVLNLTYN
jgi:hypothetical protein